MKRQIQVALLAFLVSIPLSQAIRSSLEALGSSRGGAWVEALGYILMSSVSLSCAVALLALLDSRQPPPRMIALLDWRALRSARRLGSAGSHAPARGAPRDI